MYATFKLKFLHRWSEYSDTGRIDVVPIPHTGELSAFPSRI